MICLHKANPSFAPVWAEHQLAQMESTGQHLTNPDRAFSLLFDLTGKNLSIFNTLEESPIKYIRDQRNFSISYKIHLLADVFEYNTLIKFTL